MANKLVDREVLKAFREKLDDKYVIEGEYSPSTSVGLADNADALTPYGENSGANDTTPFVFQSTGGNSDVGSKAYLRALRGNSVAWNQLQKISARSSFTDSDTGLTVTNNNDGSWTITGTVIAEKSDIGITNSGDLTTLNGHKYLTRYIGLSNYLKFRLAGQSNSNSGFGQENIIWLGTADRVNNTTIYMSVGNNAVGQTINVTIKPQTFDLTLLGKEYSTVLAFNRDYPLSYYPYNAGTLLSCKSNGIKNVGYNAWDEQWEVGIINNVTGQNDVSNSNIRSKNYIRVISGQTYVWDAPINNGLCFYDGNKNFITIGYFLAGADVVIPNNCCFIRFYCGTAYGTTYKNDIAIHLKWDGSRTGYEPYESNTYSLPNVELRSAGSVYDELKQNGTLIRRVGYVDLGTIPSNEWYKGSESRFTCYLSNNTIPNFKQTANGNIVPNMLCSKWQVVSNSSVLSSTGYNSIYTVGDMLFIKDSAYDSYTTTQFAAAISGIYLNYELATPTIEQTDNTFQEIQDIDDFGTQEFLSSDSIVIPQGNEFFYPVDYKAFIDSLGGREDIEYDASEIVSQTQLSVEDTKVNNLYGIIQENIGGMLRQQLVANVIASGGTLNFNNTAWVDLGNLTWEKESNGVFRVHLDYIKGSSSYTTVGNILCPKYKTVAPNITNEDKVIKITDITSYFYMRVYDTNYTDATTFKNAMKGILLAYEKA